MFRKFFPLPPLTSLAHFKPPYLVLLLTKPYDFNRHLTTSALNIPLKKILTLSPKLPSTLSIVTLLLNTILPSPAPVPLNNGKECVAMIPLCVFSLISNGYLLALLLLVKLTYLSTIVFGPKTTPSGKKILLALFGTANALGNKPPSLLLPTTLLPKPLSLCQVFVVTPV